MPGLKHNTLFFLPHTEGYVATNNIPRATEIVTTPQQSTTVSVNFPVGDELFWTSTPDASVSAIVGDIITVTGTVRLGHSVLLVVHATPLLFIG
jgi:hypothetical protein